MTQIQYTNGDDFWRDCPDDIAFVHGLNLGDKFTLTTNKTPFEAKFMVTKVPDGASDDYEVAEVASAWTTPVALGRVNAAYDQGFSDGVSECYRLNAPLLQDLAAHEASNRIKTENLETLRERVTYLEEALRDAITAFDAIDGAFDVDRNICTFAALDARAALGESDGVL